jgi:hypothetical protein
MKLARGLPFQRPGVDVDQTVEPRTNLQGRTGCIMHVISADILAADLATELEMTARQADQYLEALCEEDEDDRSSAGSDD